MLLRRFTEHVRSQNWFAVGLDFVIVVIGVLVGLQVNNWNDARAGHARYEEAREQLIGETEANLRLVQTYNELYKTRLIDVRAAISVLRNCGTGADALKTVERGLDTLRSTPPLTLQNSALAFLTENDQMLAIQDDEERARLQSYYRAIRGTLDGAEVIEHLPDRSPVEDHPMVSYGELSEDYMPANGADERPLVLIAPLEEACQDMALAKHFYLWERVGVFANLISGRLEDGLQKNLDILKERP